MKTREQKLRELGDRLQSMAKEALELLYRPDKESQLRSLRLCLFIAAIRMHEYALVYFIQSGGEGGPVKIGISLDPGKRLRSMQIGTPEKLELLGTVPGGRTLESGLHEHFARDRIHGEWFKWSEGLGTRIRNLCGPVEVAA